MHISSRDCAAVSVGRTLAARGRACEFIVFSVICAIVATGDVLYSPLNKTSLFLALLAAALLWRELYAGIYISENLGISRRPKEREKKMRGNAPRIEEIIARERDSEKLILRIHSVRS